MSETLLERIKRHASEPNDCITVFAGDILEVIAQAVTAEREACASLADGVWHLLDVEGNDHDHVVTEPIAAAIRARNSAGRK